MDAPTTTPGNLLINGRFLPGLWTRLTDAVAGTPTRCPVWAQTFAADRWHLRYSAPAGAEVLQSRSSSVPDASPARCSLEIAGAEGVTEEVRVGQCVEAEEAAAQRGPLRFSAWLLAEHPSLCACEPALVIGHPVTADLFDSTVEEPVRLAARSVPVNRWHRLEFAFDTADLRETGLRVELALPAAFLAHPAARVRLTDAALSRVGSLPAERLAAVETFLARRFCQRHDGTRLNAVGRALTCNPHELFFQFTFPEMRAVPSCTLSQDNAELCVFSADGQPQTGFAYDVTYASRGSVIIRATKLRHQLRDGYLAFRGYRGAILLDAEP
jgi:hypothetical protein